MSIGNAALALMVRATNPAFASDDARYERPAALSISLRPAGQGYVPSSTATPEGRWQSRNEPCSIRTTGAGPLPAGRAIRPFSGAVKSWWLPSHSATCTVRVPSE